MSAACANPYHLTPAPAERYVAGEFGARLKDSRETRGLSYDKLAAKCGLSKPYLWELETSGAANPTLNSVFAIAAALEVSVAWLIGIAPMNPKPVEAVR